MTTATSTFHKVNPVTLASWSTAPTLYAEPDGIGDEPETPPVWPEENGYALLDTLMTRINQGRCVTCGSLFHLTVYCPPARPLGHLCRGTGAALDGDLASRPTPTKGR